MHPLLTTEALRGSRARNAFCAALICLLAVSETALADTDTTDHDAGNDVRIDVGIGRFEGKYGLDDTTTVDLLNITGRWYLPRGELQVSLPYLRIDGPADIRFVGGQPATGPGTGLDGQRTESGIGDVVLRGDYYLMRGTTTRPWVIGLLRVKLPTGDEDKGLSTGATDVEAGVGLIQRVGRVDVLADAGYTWVGSTSDFDLRNVVRLGAGASMPFGPSNSNSAYLYVENRTNTIKGNSDRQLLSVGASTSLGEQLRTRVTASLFFGLSSTAEDFGVYVATGHRF
jgi:hypothetical protein